MYPAQTSFIPFTVALVRFIAEGGSIWGNYPYWYLGEVPFRYLTGPVVPALILGLDRLFGGLSLFDWSLVLVVIAWAVAALGWGILASLLSGKKRVGLLVGILYLVSPWHIVSSLALGETSGVLASSVGPWVLLAFARISNFKFQILNEKLEIAKFFLLIVLFAVLLLINTVVSIPTILGLGILSFVLYKHPTEGLKRAGLVIFLGGLLTIWWYDLGYWLRILFAPSFGGRSVVGSLLYVVDMARTLLPVVLAFIVVVWKVKPKTNFEKFSYLWFGSFVGLTLVRFAANVHFWLDWTSWFGEIEVGFALVFAGYFGKNALLFGHSFGRDQRSAVGLHEVQISQNSEITPSRVTSPRVYPEIDRRAGTPSALATPLGALLLILLFVITGWVLVFANRNFWMPRRNIENTIEYKVAKWFEMNSMNCELLTMNCPTVFLSGTTAFWLNSLVDVRQVRGGADQVGLIPELAITVWDVRTGGDAQKSVDALKKMGINYLVVHSNYSKEFYHDFENPWKFEGLESLLKVYSENGDIIYRVR